MQDNFSKYVDKGILVNEYLQIPDRKNIFVAGDVTNIIEEKTAQNAEHHGKIAASMLEEEKKL
jgi:NADH dehydrogenase FAD-containing subunit